MELLVLDSQGQRTATLEVSDAVFGREYNEALVHQIVVAYQGNARSGDRAQKNRSAVRHSTKKPWRQKGTGRARSGMTSSPIWRGGGRTFPNSPDENFSQKVNRKMYRAGMAALLSQLAREERLAVIEDFTLESPKTKGLVQKLKAMGLDTGLLITDTVDENLYLSARNLPGIGVVEVRYADPVSLMYFPRVVLTKGAIAKLEELMK